MRAKVQAKALLSDRARGIQRAVAAGFMAVVAGALLSSWLVLRIGAFLPEWPFAVRFAARLLVAGSWAFVCLPSVMWIYGRLTAERGVAAVGWAVGTSFFFHFALAWVVGGPGALLGAMDAQLSILLQAAGGFGLGLLALRHGSRRAQRAAERASVPASPAEREALERFARGEGAPEDHER